MNRIIFLLLFISTYLHSGIHQQAISDYKVDQKQTHVLEMIKSLPKVGILKKKSNGYVYLKVSDEYITKVFPNLILDGHLRPTGSFGSEEGAHITVVTDTEKCAIAEEELDKEFHFEVKELRIVESWKSIVLGGGGTKYHTGDRWMIAVECPELEELRMRYGLAPLIEEHDFHISIGFEVPFNRINNFGDRPPK